MIKPWECPKCGSTNWRIRYKNEWQITAYCAPCNQDFFIEIKKPKHIE